MSTEHPQVSQGSQIDGFTVGGLVRSRNGAATYDATDASGQAVHLTVYADACFSSGLVRDKALRELGQLQGAAAPEVAKVQACGKYGEGIYEVTEVVAGETLRNAEAMSDEDAAAVKAAYEANYQRLVDIKRKYDPDNFWSGNQNIAPN